MINQNYLSYIINSPFISGEKSKELFLLKKKRESEYFTPKINHNIIIQKEKTFSIINSNKLENIRQINESRNVINEIQPDPINYEINNFKNLLSESSDYLNQEKYNNKARIIINDKEGNLLNNSSTNRNPSTKLKFFKIEKNINTRSILDFNTNNEIKVLKNKKIVYINTDLLNNHSTSRYIKKPKDINFVIRNKTSSKFRGVSRNGNMANINCGK